MTEMMNQLSLYFTYPFVRYALVVGVLISLCAALLGIPLVLKRYSHMGEGLSHVAFGATAVASILQLTNRMWIVLPCTIVVSILLLKDGEQKKIKGDAALGMLSVGSLAIGYFLMNVFGKSSNLSGDICSILFGSTSILTLSQGDVWQSIILAVIVIGSFIVLYHKIFAVTFDPVFAEASGVGAKKYNLLLAVLTAVVIVLAINLVGSLLITALIIFPAMSAMRLAKSFRVVTICAAIISVVAAIIGIVVSILISTPVGSMIVIADLVIFMICSVIGKVTGGR